LNLKILLFLDFHENYIYSVKDCFYLYMKILLDLRFSGCTKIFQVHENIFCLNIFMNIF